MPRRLIILGSTGSIGTQTIEVIEHLARSGGGGEGFEIVGLAAGRNADVLAAQARRLGVRDIAVADERAVADVPGARVRRGVNAAEQLVREVECDIVLGAMVGAAGLPATLAAVELGRDVALANKETLVAAGALVIPAAIKSGSKLLPVDSEHCGVWQCLQSLRLDASMPRCLDASLPVKPALCPPLTCGLEVVKVILTASGGPFRTWSKDRIEGASPREALNHPTWSMGPKVTIDSASLTNKALEVIEAHWLFGLGAERIGVLVHPQSVVHALVEYADGNVVAQLGPPDMRSPIQYALTWPDRPAGVSRKIDWKALSKLEFAEPDLDRFPALEAGFEVVRRGGTAGAVFNAANEAAVQAFLAGHDVGPGGNGGIGGARLCDGLRPIRFGEISRLSREALDEVGVSPLNTLDDALRADAEARRFVQRRLAH